MFSIKKALVSQGFRNSLVGYFFFAAGFLAAGFLAAVFFAAGFAAFAGIFFPSPFALLRSIP